MTKLVPFSLPPAVNTVTKLITNPCDEPFTVYVETARRPAGRLAIGLLSFGLTDVVRGMLRPNVGARGGPPGRHMRGSRPPKFGGGIGIPEVGNRIGKSLLSDDFRTPSNESDFNALWKLDGVLQRGLFYMLVVDLVSDFLYQWSTAIIQVETDKNCFFASGLLEGGPGVRTPLTGWTTGIMQEVYGPWPPFPTPLWTAGGKGGFATFSITATSQDPFRPGSGFGVAMQNVDGSFASSDIKSTFAVQTVEASAGANLRPFQQIGAVTRAFNVAHNTDNGSFFAVSF